MRELKKIWKKWSKTGKMGCPGKVRKRCKKGSKRVQNTVRTASGHGISHETRGGRKKRVFFQKTDIDRKFFLIFTFWVFFWDLIIKFICSMENYYFFVILWYFYITYKYFLEFRGFLEVYFGAFFGLFRKFYLFHYL